MGATGRAESTPSLTGGSLGDVGRGDRTELGGLGGKRLRVRVPAPYVVHMTSDFEALDLDLRDGRTIYIWTAAPPVEGPRHLAWLEALSNHDICIDPVMVARAPERLNARLRQLLPEEDQLHPSFELLVAEILRRC